MGYTQEDKRGFQLLHSFAFVIHLISCVFAYHLIPPSSKMKQYVYVEAVEFTITATGEPTIDIQKKSAFDNANAIAIIALNELLATVSHGIALSILTCNSFLTSSKEPDFLTVSQVWFCIFWKRK